MAAAAHEAPVLEETQDAKRAKTDQVHEGYTFNINKAVDADHVNKSFTELIKLPPSALRGLKEGVADEMLAAFKITTIEELANWKFYKIAKSIAVLAATEESGKRGATCALNLNHALDKEFEKKTLAELLAAPPSALQGLAEWVDTSLKAFAIKTVGDLATFKFCCWAEALVTLAEYETADFSS